MYEVLYAHHMLLRKEDNEHKGKIARFVAGGGGGNKKNHVSTATRNIRTGSILLRC